MKVNLLLILFFSVIGNMVFAYQDSLMAIAFKNKAIEFINQENKDSTKFYEKLSADIFSKNDDIENWSNLYKSIGRAFRDVGQYQLALNYFDRSIEIRNKQLINPMDYRRLAFLFAEIAYTYKLLNDLNEIVENYERSAQIFEEYVPGSDSLMAVYIYGELGNAYNRLRDYDNAAYYLKLRAEILLKEKSWDELAKSYNDLAYIYQNKEEYKKAIEIYQKGLSINDFGFDQKVLLLENIGYAYLLAGDNSNGLKYIRECEELIRSSGLSGQEKSEYLIWVYNDLAEYFGSVGNYLKSEEYYKKAIKNITRTNPLDKRNLTLVYMNKASMSLGNGQYLQAFTDFNKCLELLIPSFNSQKINELPNINELPAEPNLIEVLGGMAEAASKIKKEDSSFSAEAADYYELAAVVENILLKQYLLEGSKFSALKEHRWVKAAYLEQLFIGISDVNRKKMFSIAEENRALVLMDGVQAAKNFSQSKLGESLKIKLDSINQCITQLELALNHEKNKKNELAGIQLLKAKKDKADLLKNIKVKNQSGHDLQNLINPETVAKHLNEDQAILQYFLHDTSAFLFVVSPKLKNIYIEKIEWDSSCTQMANTIKEDIFNGNNASYFRKASALYNCLIKPALEITDADHLIILPDGELWNVPFDALLAKPIEAEKEINFKNLSYLNKDYKISYAFSATLFHEMNKKIEGPENREVYVFAPSYRELKKPTPPSESPLAYAERNEIGPLLHNGTEARTVARLAGGRHVCKEKATSGWFMEMWEQAKVLHIASHAQANHDEPNMSFIAFSNMEDTMDFKVYVNELYHKTAPLEMVVLSACETGTGPVWKGEGAISIARAFAFSGTRSIVNSLWNLDDGTAEFLMTRFYRHLKDGKTKDEALQLAKKDFIEKAERQEEAHPRFWATFTAIGNMDPIDLSWSLSDWIYHYWRWGILVLLLAGIIVFFFWRRKRSEKRT